MKPFRFTLEKVLSWRQAQLALEEAGLERLRSDLRNIQAAILELARRDEAETERLRKMQTTTGSGVLDLARFREWVVREKKILTARSLECGRKIEKQSAVVTEARRKVELIERLKQRRRSAWDAEFNFELEQLAGEAALGMWRRDKGQTRED